MNAKRISLALPVKEIIILSLLLFISSISGLISPPANSIFPAPYTQAVYLSGGLAAVLQMVLLFCSRKLRFARVYIAICLFLETAYIILAAACAFFVMEQPAVKILLFVAAAGLAALAITALFRLRRTN